MLQPDVFLSFNLLSHLPLWLFQYSAIYLARHHFFVSLFSSFLIFNGGISSKEYLLACVWFQTRLYQNLPGPATQAAKLIKSGLSAQWDGVTNRRHRNRGGKKKKRRVIFIVIHCVCPCVWLGVEGPISQCAILSQHYS